jgi:hypothetical protein
LTKIPPLVNVIALMIILLNTLVSDHISVL